VKSVPTLLSLCLPIDGLSTVVVFGGRETLTFTPAETLFYQLSGNKLPGIIGVVDGIHVAIKAPATEEEAYYCRKGYHAVNCQVVADSDYLILDCVARNPGRDHDSFVWKHNSVRERLH